MSQLTSAQQRAVLANGNVLVEAGAGTGKTRTLVERCLARLADPLHPVSLKEMVIVTFTEAAAAEMRQRLRAALEKLCLAQPGNHRLEEQLASLDSAWISTLHGFCYGLAREHFHELELDPQFTILTDAQAKVLAQEVLDTVFRQPEHAARMRVLHQWSRERGQSGRQRLREQVLRLYHYARALREPQAWLQAQLNAFTTGEPKPWLTAWADEIPRWAVFWREALIASGNTSLVTYAEQFAVPERMSARAEAAAWLERLRATIPPKKETPKTWAKRLESLAGELEFLLSLAAAGEGTVPEADWPALREDWEWTRPAMAELLRLVQAFAAEFQRRKQELGGVDFSDLEHFALRVLWDAEKHQLRPAAEVWRQRTQLLFIDEYQDINEAQDAILECLARPDATGNRFLVGDVKQSIYQFRLANPRIFLGYAKTWGQPGAAGQVLRLTENFRSHPAILEFANRFFTGLMREAAGGVDYSAETALQPGDPSHARFQDSPATLPRPRVELHLLLSDEEEDFPEASSLSAAEGEARLIGQRLLALHQQVTPIWDEAANALRPVEWRDMAILLRAPRGQAEVIAKEFARLGIPLGASRSSFFEAIETTDWLNLLRLLDNPFQDLPLLAVLRSPLANFTTEDLAQLRLAGRACPLWTALQALARAKKSEAASAKARQFLERHARWRQMARVSALSDCLAAMLDETLYEAWLSLQPRAAQRLANIRQLLEIARQFDQFQRQGLFRFLRFMEAQIDAEAGLEAAAPETGNAVRLISIHHSKGLEFPVVVVAGLAKKFNDQDLHGSLILDQQLGLCPLVRAPQGGAKYPSLAHWFARRRQRQELAGEEMRLLYVAMTRARDYLLLTGQVKLAKIGEWAEGAGQPLSLMEISGARSCLDWVGPRCAALVPGGDLSIAGQADGFAWQIHAINELSEPIPVAPAEIAASASSVLTPADMETLRERLAWVYPHLSTTKEPGKTSVSAWRKRVLEETRTEAYPLFADEPSVVETAAGTGAAKAPATLAATDIGTIHHRFLEWVAFDKTHSQCELEAEAERLVAAAVLTPEERAALDMPALWGFWNSPLGQQVRAHAPQVRRELPFTARFTPEELRAWVAGQLPPLEASEAGDFIIVQGVVDLAVILERELWVVDYKTGEVRPEDLEKKARAYAPQLALYATALARIYRRPATQCWLHFLMPGQSVNVTAMNLL